MNIDWKTLTQAKAKRLIGAASREVDRLAVIFDKTGTDEAESAWWNSYLVYENLLVFSKTGEKPQ